MISFFNDFFRKYLFLMKTSKLRFILTIVGIFVASIFFLGGKIVTDSTEYNILRTVEEFNDDTIIYSNISENSYKYLQRITDTKIFVPFSRDKKSFIKVKDQIDYTYSYDVIATSNYFSISGIPFKDGSSLSSVDYLEGRTWTSEETDSKAKVVVISSATKHIMFNDEDPIGKNLEIQDLGNFLVIGVIDDLLEFEFERINFNRTKSNNDRVYYPSLDVLIPLTTYNGIVNTPKDIPFTQLLQVHDNANGIANAISDTYLTNYDDLKNNTTKQKRLIIIEKILEDYNKKFNLAFIVTAFLTGLIIMITMFFSVKERIFEIGVRVSFGASRVDILKQFITETLIFTIISGFIALVFTKAVIVIGNLVIQNGYRLHIDKESIYLYCLVALGQALIFGLAPAIYATKIKIIDALNFE